ncbi:MAG: AraC family transcriptional regulator, partial [Lachnospiraceae bacterium]
TEYSLQEISSVCAFSSQSRFCDYFQRKNGITPSKYRKKYKKR